MQGRCQGISEEEFVVVSSSLRWMAFASQRSILLIQPFLVVLLCQRTIEYETLWRKYNSSGLGAPKPFVSFPASKMYKVLGISCQNHFQIFHPCYRGLRKSFS